jgi:hypothetical protein
MLIRLRRMPRRQSIDWALYVLDQAECALVDAVIARVDAHDLALND